MTASRTVQPKALMPGPARAHYEARPAQDEVDLKVTFVRAILLPEKVCKDGSLTGTVKNTSLFVSRQKTAALPYLVESLLVKRKIMHLFK
ncbi:uncharacterized protein ACIB01_010124 [Guaruba guarouba]